MKTKTWYFIGLVVLIIIFLGWSRKEKTSASVDIILSPHYKDAALSLSELISGEKGKTVVVAFFAGTSDSGSADYNYGYADSKNRSADDDSNLISQSISKDIQALVASYAQGSTTVRVYGPSDFGEAITSPEGKLLHDAYVNVIGSYPKSNIDFYFYEDLPYIENFNKTSSISIQKYLENETGFLLDSELIGSSEKVYKVFRPDIPTTFSF